MMNRLISKYLNGNKFPKVTLVDSDKVRMNNSSVFFDENGNIIGDSVVLPDITIKPSAPQTNSQPEYERWLLRESERGGRNFSANDREAYDKMMQRIANQNEVKNFTGFDGAVYNHGSGALEQVSPEFDALTIGRQLYTDGLFNLIGESAGRNIGNTINRGKLLYNIEKTPVNNDKLLNDAMLNDLTFVNGAFRSKSSLGAKTVEDVTSFTYGLPKGITPKTKLSSLTNNQIYDLALRDIKRESANDWFIGIGNSAKNNRYIHMDANSSIIPTTEGFLPTREGFTKVGRYGTPEIWYNKNIPYYPIELSKTPRTVVTTQKALGIEDVFENVAHTPRTLKYEDILYGLEPNEFGSYNRVLYSPYRRAPLNNTPYNPSTIPNNIFNIKTPKNAIPKTPEQWTAAQDAAIARGDIAKAQRLRDLHFQVSAPNQYISKGVYLPSESQPIISQADYYNGNNDLVTLYHSSVDADNLIKKGFDGVERGLGRTKGEAKGTIFASANPDYAADYSNLYVQEGYSTPDKVGLIELKVPRGAGTYEGSEVRLRPEHIKQITKSAYEKTPWLKWLKTRKTDNSLFNIKSADAVTYDDNGVRIPLGLRDNFRSKDIRYGIIPIIGGAALSNQYAKGGSIHISPSKRGTFTATATKHGMGVQEFASKVLEFKQH